MDIIGAARYADDITWWENADGTGTTWAEHTVNSSFDGASAVYAADIDGDGDMDILGAAYGADEITWWENTDGTGSTWIEHIIDGSFDGVESVYAADIDGDGDMDILGAAHDADDIAWWGPGLNLHVTAPHEVNEGDEILLSQGQISIPASLPEDLKVSLFSDDTSEIIVPEIVTIIAGQTSASFDLTVINDDIPDETQTVKIYAAAEDYSSAFVEILVEGNDGPVINQSSPVTVTMDEDGLPTGWEAPEISASGVDEQSFIWSLSVPPAHGTATVNGTGISPAVLIYAPNPDYYGTDTFEIQVSDASGNTDKITINVTIIDKTAPTYQISYNPATLCNQDVVATITLSDGTVTSEGGANHTFTANGSWTFEFSDAVGNTGTALAEVNWIDKTPPTATITYSTTGPTNQDVTATLNPSEQVTITNNNGLTTKTFTENGDFTFEFMDAAGNSGTAVAVVNNIDRTVPTSQISYNPATLCHQDVIATITLSDGAVTSEGGVTHTFTANGSWTFKFSDAAGNNGTALAEVNWIEIIYPIASMTDAPYGTINTTEYTVTVWGINLESYMFKVDNEAWSGETGVDEPITFTADAEGEHTLYVIGKLAEGTWQAKEFATTATWTVDTTPPTATITNYPRGTIGATSINVVIGGEDVQYYKYRMDDCPWSVAFSAATPLRIDDLAEVDHRLDVIGGDTAGNWQDVTEASTVTWAIDLTVQTAVLSNVPNGITKERSANITVSDGEGGEELDAYYYSLDEGDSWNYKAVTETIQLTDLAEGVYTLYVNAHRAANDIWQDGQDGQSTDNATSYTWTVDLTPPITNLSLSATAGSPPTSTVLLSWDSVETGLKGYHLWYSKQEIDEGNLAAATKLFCTIIPGPAEHTETYTLRGLSSNTRYYFGLQSEDAAGNVSGISNIATLTTEETLPTISEFHLTDGGITADNSVIRELTITGTNFVNGAGNAIRFISSSGIFNVNSKSGGNTEIKVDVPAGAPIGTYKIRVCNMYGTSAASEQIYTVTKAPAPLPEVTNVFPAIGPNDKDSAVTITGDNFIGVLTVKLISAAGITAATLTDVASVSVNEITATVPAGVDEGTYYLQVCTANGCNGLSIAKFEVYNPMDLSAATGATSTTKGVDMPDDGIVPVRLSLSTDNREVVGPVSDNKVEIEVSIDPGTKITLADGEIYSGTIDPPRQVPPTQAIKAELGPNAVLFTMGSATEKLEFAGDQTIFAKVDITMPSNAAVSSIYYVEADGSLTVAGVDGTYNGQIIESGGTVLATQVGVPEDGYTTYTFGLLLDHMSTFAASAETSAVDAETSAAPSESGGGGGGGGCFINSVLSKTRFAPYFDNLIQR